ncbi:uncharacterized protein I206_105399 [Kwoniella pini CBS 10737]|uniref:Peroxin-11C n=1 Tax=Kwoniella pini CBS 10737 TaxID=1296096 RepID=A0A1B9I4D2_9TREE|nr:uncharacterized protein I206_03695 [Kwoniella pini CBS 10737]OCF50374.1 hypothetical protein I206_03695 [Kwoniella pini CBS 10737]
MSSKSSSKISLTSPIYLLSRLTKLTSTYSGLDASLMLVQYSSPLVIALLLRLAALKSKFRSNKNGQAFGLVKLAEGWAKMGGSVGEARVVFRAFGLLPILTWLLSLHPNPLQSIPKLVYSINKQGLAAFSSPKTLPTLQALSLLLYYPLEHLTWLYSKGVIPLNAQRAAKAGLWSVRFWALYVLLDIYKLRQTYSSLLQRTKLLRNSKPEIKEKEAEGYELSKSEQTPVQQSTEEDKITMKGALTKDWKVWKNDVMINAGYAPLTVHWSTPGGLWAHPLIGGSLGIMAAIGRLTAEWRKGD